LPDLRAFAAGAGGLTMHTIPAMTSDTVVQVEELISALPNEDLWGSFKASSIDRNRLELVGWALGTRSEVERIEIVAGANVVGSTAPSLPRAEIAQEFPDRESAASCGFEVTMEATGKGRSMLALRAVLDDGSRAPLGELRVVASGRD